MNRRSIVCAISPDCSGRTYAHSCHSKIFSGHWMVSLRSPATRNTVKPRWRRLSMPLRTRAVPMGCLIGALRLPMMHSEKKYSVGVQGILTTIV